MDTSFGTLVRVAWREAKVNASAQGAATEPMLGAAYPPRAFIEEELGFGMGEGPSLQVTLIHLEAHNRRARKQLDHVLRRPTGRESALAKQKRLQAIAKQTMLTRGIKAA